MADVEDVTVTITATADVDAADEMLSEAERMMEEVHFERVEDRALVFALVGIGRVLLARERRMMR